MTCKEAIENLRALDRRDALVLADAIVDDTIAVLRRDRNNSFRSFTEWELALADLHARIADRIAGEIAGHVDVAAVLIEFEAAVDWQEVFDA